MVVLLLGWLAILTEYPDDVDRGVVVVVFLVDPGRQDRAHTGLITIRLREQRASTCENCMETTVLIKLLRKSSVQYIDIRRAATVPAE